MIGFCQDLGERDFTVKGKSINRKREGKRGYLNHSEARSMIDRLQEYLESRVKIPFEANVKALN